MCITQSINNLAASEYRHRAGEAAINFLTTPEALPTISENNAATVHEFLVSVTNEELFAEFITIAQTVIFGRASNEHISLGFELLDSRYLNMGQVYLEVFRCVFNDGMLVTTFAGGIQDSSVQAQFSDCQSLLLDGQKMNGAIDRRWTLIKYAYNPGTDTTYSFGPLELTSIEGRNRTLLGSLKPLPNDESTAAATMVSQCSGKYIEHYR